MGPVTDEMNAIPLPLEEELALVEDAEPEASADEQDTAEVDIVDVVDDLLEPESPGNQEVESGFPGTAAQPAAGSASISDFVSRICRVPVVPMTGNGGTNAVSRPQGRIAAHRAA